MISGAVVVSLMAGSAMALVTPPNMVGDPHFNQLDVSGASPSEGFVGFWRYGSINNWTLVRVPAQNGPRPGMARL